MALNDHVPHQVMSLVIKATDSPYQMWPGHIYQYDLTEGSITLIMPGSAQGAPLPNQWVRIKDISGTDDHGNLVTIQPQTGPTDLVEEPQVDTGSVLTTTPFVIGGNFYRGIRWVYSGDEWFIDGTYSSINTPLRLFSFAGYGAASAPVDSSFPNLGGSWQHLDIFTIQQVTPRGITIDTVNSQFSFDLDGVYYMNVSGAMEHNEVNSGREFYLRLYNVTTATPGSSLVFGTGRNQGVTLISTGLLFEITEAEKNDVFQLEIGNGSTYSSVNFQQLGYDLFSVGEWREPLS